MELEVKDLVAKLDEAANELGKMKAEHEKALKGMASIESMDAIKADVVAKTEQIKKLSEQLDTIEAAGKLQMNGKKVSQTEVFAKAIEDNMERIKSGVNANQNVTFKVGLNTKAAGTIVAANFATGVIRGLFDDEVIAAPKAPLTLLSRINTSFGGPGSNPWTWRERNAGEGAAAQVAESGTKSYMDFDWVKGEATAKTTAAVVPVTKQSVLNYPSLLNEINGELMDELKAKLKYQILLGDNTGENLFGIYPGATSFSAGGLAVLVVSPNRMDALRAAVAHCYRNKFVPDTILVHPDAIALMDLEKGNNNHYVLPPFVTSDGNTISGVPIIPDFDLTTDQYVVMDAKKYGYNIVEDINIEIGLINDQFLKNEFCVRAELYGMGRIKVHHRKAFIKGLFSTTITAITKP